MSAFEGAEHLLESAGVAGILAGVTDVAARHQCGGELHRHVQWRVRRWIGSAGRHSDRCALHQDSSTIVRTVSESRIRVGSSTGYEFGAQHLVRFCRKRTASPGPGPLQVTRVGIDRLGTWRLDSQDVAG